MEKTSEEFRADSVEARAEWVRPEVREMQAGDAENLGGATFDGGSGQS